MTEPLGMAESVQVVEVGPRDGLQNEATILAAEDKVRFIELAIAAGVRRVEAVSFVRPDAVPQMADAEKVMAQVSRRDDVSYIGLVLNRRGFQRALDSGVDEINLVLAASNSFNLRNQKATTDSLVAMVEEVLDLASSAGMPASVTIATAFGCPFEGEVPPDVVAGLVARASAAGAREIALADTIGVGVPRQVRELFDIARGLTDAPLRAHFHNTRNTGYANAVTALDIGVDILDSSIGGIGGCPFAPRATGNIATEDLVYTLDRSGYASGLSVPALVTAAEFVGKKLGKEVPSMVSKAGGFPRGAAS
ncbi:hydroxymethylglutaryl-CoA lyase [Streptomyces brasiliensis]|uniref:Hydroxymethylglutaryl-CoA lyase n=1 Tax=Streptomyces brasiliensis TaxID=1954 RepID=A0A917L3H0_9ACTN|nr:hydroxymethylglutaryl-CoA lyase [Streptomyces brasiliensis]GGJ41022.1 hydroxymethylglutaryl-CoA lyase [Streptomyces brasiliensis]